MPSESVLWANQEVLNGLSRRFQTGGAEVSLLHIAVLVAVVVVTAVVWWVVSHWGARSEGHSYCNARRLFRDLCLIHELDWPSRRLLRQLARAHSPTPPAQVFVEPDWFDAPRLPEDLQAYRRQLAALKERLF